MTDTRKLTTKEREIWGLLRQLTAPDGKSRASARQIMLNMPEVDRKTAVQLIKTFDERHGFGYPLNKEKLINDISTWDAEAVFGQLSLPPINDEERRRIEVLISNLQSRDGVARAEAANELIRIGGHAVPFLLNSVPTAPRERQHEIVITLERINPDSATRVKQFLATAKWKS